VTAYKVNKKHVKVVRLETSRTFVFRVEPQYSWKKKGSPKRRYRFMETSFSIKEKFFSFQYENFFSSQ
jgi:hypothetical protein